MILALLNSYFIQTMGPFKYPLILISVLVLLLMVYVVYLKFRSTNGETLKLKSSLNALLVLGSFNLALGMLGQITGIWNAIDAIKAAGDINPDIVMTGIKVSFGTTLFGLATFMTAALAWLILTYLPVRK